MPYFSSCQIPAPKHWQDFESLCCDLWECEWNNKIIKHGRSGQKQNGVDLVSYREDKNEYAGIQCKCIERARSLNKNEILREIELAKSFEPKLKHFVIATTGKKDVKVERLCRQINITHSSEGLFCIELYNWDDIVRLLEKNQAVAKKYFPFLQPIVLSNELSDMGSGWRHSKYSFTRDDFIHPFIVKALKGWLSDSGHPIASINLNAANSSNQFFGKIILKKIGKDKLLVSCLEEESGYFDYYHVGVSTSGVHILHCLESGGGSGIFNSLIFLVMQRDQSIDFQETVPVVKEREILKILGSIQLGDRYDGKITYKNSQLRIGKDKSLMKYGQITQNIIIEVK